MSGARALVAAVPQRVWTAVAGLVLLASLGVALVLGAGLSTWQGAVSHAPNAGAERAPLTVVPAPGSAVIVVPTHSAPVPHAPAVATGQPATTGQPAATGVAVAVPATDTIPTAAPAVSTTPVVPVATARTARPRTAALTTDLTATSPKTGPGRGVGNSKHHDAAVHRAGHHRHANHGKHLGWTKGVRAGSGRSFNG